MRRRLGAFAIPAPASSFRYFFEEVNAIAIAPDPPVQCLFPDIGYPLIIAERPVLSGETAKDTPAIPGVYGFSGSPFKTGRGLPWISLSSQEDSSAFPVEWATGSPGIAQGPDDFSVEDDEGEEVRPIMQEDRFESPPIGRAEIFDVDHRDLPPLDIVHPRGAQDF